ALQLGEHRDGDVFLIFDDHGLSSETGTNRVMTSFVGTRVKAKELRRQERSCAAASKHRGQTQSEPDWGSGMGRRKGGAAHQHSPPSPQSKAATRADDPAWRDGVGCVHQAIIPRERPRYEPLPA